MHLTQCRVAEPDKQSCEETGNGHSHACASTWRDPIRRHTAPRKTPGERLMVPAVKWANETSPPGERLMVPATQEATTIAQKERAWANGSQAAGTRTPYTAKRKTHTHAQGPANPWTKPGRKAHRRKHRQRCSRRGASVFVFSKTESPPAKGSRDKSIVQNN